MKSVCAALAVIIVLLATLSLGKISDEFLVHKLRLEESSCIDACVAAKQRVSSCDNFCNQAVTSANVVQRVVRAVEQEQVEKQEESLSDFVGSEAVKEQNEATKHLWELFHTNMKSLLSNGLGAEGFQLLPNALEMSSIREFDVQHPSQLRHLPADDFDNPVILAREVMQATKPGPFRLTKGIRIIDEYRAFLSGVRGVKNVKHLNAKNSLAVKYGKMFAEAVSECARKYSSDMKMAMAFTFERYESLFCRNVADKKQMMYAQIGKEKAQQGNNPVYGAAVALGLAQEYTESTALTKLQSVRAMEFDCVQAQNGLATYRASPRQMQFAYNHRNWKNTEKTSSFSVSVGFSVFNAQYGKNDAKATGLDLTSVGGVSIAFADYKYIPLYPGTWYSPTAFKDFRYMPRENNKRSAIANFFGAQGTLRLFPKGLYVGVNPTIGFSVQNSKKTSFMKSTSTAISVGATVFGMNLGVNYNKGAKVEQGKESGGNTMINIVSQSCIPQLFAVDYEHNY